MLQINDWEVRKKEYERFWSMSNEKPLLAVTAPMDKDRRFAIPDLKTKWFDEKWFIRNAREQFANTYFGGVSYPHVMPSLGPALLCGILGSEIVFDRNTSWTKHREEPLEAFFSQPLDRDNRWFRMMYRFLEAYAEDAKNGDYIVGMVDLNTMVDGISSLIGPERMCMDLLDYPEEMERVLKENVSLYKQVFEEYYPLTVKYQKGTTNWLSVYSEIPAYFISVDFIVMISDEGFMRFVDEPLRDLAKYHERVILHLDGENAVRHLDRILDVEDIEAVQVQATPLAHSAKLWLPYIHKIQEKGKGVHIEAKTLEDVELLKRECAPQGLFIKMYCENTDMAKRAESIIYG